VHEALMSLQVLKADECVHGRATCVPYINKIISSPLSFAYIDRFILYPIFKQTTAPEYCRGLSQAEVNQPCVEVYDVARITDAVRGQPEMDTQDDDADAQKVKGSVSPVDLLTAILDVSPGNHMIFLGMSFKYYFWRNTN
jgi:hypothetical protein